MQSLRWIIPDIAYEKLTYIIIRRVDQLVFCIVQIAVGSEMAASAIKIIGDKYILFGLFDDER